LNKKNKLIIRNRKQKKKELRRNSRMKMRNSSKRKMRSSKSKNMNMNINSKEKKKMKMKSKKHLRNKLKNSMRNNNNKFKMMLIYILKPTFKTILCWKTRTLTIHMPLRRIIAVQDKTLLKMTKMNKCMKKQSKSKKLKKKEKQEYTICRPSHWINLRAIKQKRNVPDNNSNLKAWAFARCHRRSIELILRSQRRRDHLANLISKWLREIEIWLQV